MSFLLDTDVCSTFVRRPAALAHRFVQHAGGLALSAVTAGELLVWAEHRGGEVRRTIEEEVLTAFEVLPYDLRCAQAFGRLRAGMLQEGVGAAPLDLQIAASAIAHDLTLVTHNTKHFESVPGLRLQDWVAG